MAIINVVKYEQQEGVVAHKFSSSELRWGTQLVVYPGQEAIFVKGGAVCDKFTEGTYTLKSANIPLLYKITALPFGGESPFQADVWFISLLEKLNMKWGTETPLQIEDPKYGIIVPVRAYGQWGFKICDSLKFLNKLLGNKPKFDEAMLQSYFRGVLLSHLTSIIARKIIAEGISIFDINIYLPEISKYCMDSLEEPLLHYGIQIVTFDIISINMPENDSSVDELKKAKNLKAQIDIAGVDGYRMRRTFDVMEASANNESGSSNFLNMGLGFGAGTALSKEFGRYVGQAMNPADGSDSVPELPDSVYYLGIGGERRGPFSLSEIKSYLSSTPDGINTLAWKPGMKGWASLSTFEEFNMPVPPPIE